MKQLREVVAACVFVPQSEQIVTICGFVCDGGRFCNCLGNTQLQ